MRTYVIKKAATGMGWFVCREIGPDDHLPLNYAFTKWGARRILRRRSTG